MAGIWGKGWWVNDCGSFLGSGGQRLWQVMGYGVVAEVVAVSGVWGGGQIDCGSHFGVRGGGQKLWQSNGVRGGGQTAEIRNSNADFRNFTHAPVSANCSSCGC